MTEADRLLRNLAGTAGQRARAEPLVEPSLEGAIARNVRSLRAQLNLSVSELAERVGISKAMMSKIENAQTSCSLATLARLAAGLDVPVTSLLRGVDADRAAVYTAAGSGSQIVRNGTQVGHHYELLGSLRGQHKRLESLLVTLTTESETYPYFQHPGTEFIYQLAGVMDYGHGASVYRLAPGDSLQFDGEGTHGPTALIELPIRFLSIVAFPDSTP